jgi:flagellar hook-length control protein FliK
MPATAAPRAASTGGTTATGGTESAAPFASALDGALSEGRAAVGEGTTGDGEQPEDESQPGTPVAAEAAALGTAAGLALPPALWGLALGATATAGQPVTAEVTGTVPATSTVGGPAGATPVAGLPATAPAVAVPGVPGPPGAPAAAALLPGADLPADPDVVAGATAPAPGTGPDATGAPAVPGASGSVVAAVPGGAAAAAAALTGTAATPAHAVPDGTTGTAGPALTTIPGIASTAAGGAGADGAGADAGGSAPGEETAAPAPALVPGGAPATGTSTTAPVAPAAGATGADASLPVSGQVARQVAVLRGAPDGSHSMTLVLTPETLGPVEVSVTVTRGTVDLVLRGAHEHGRAALLDALPDLRRDLESAGLTTSKVEVARDSGGSWLDRHAAGQQAQQGSGDRPGQQGAPDGRSRSWLTPADSGETRTVPSTGTASSGVDVRV